MAVRTLPKVTKKELQTKKTITKTASSAKRISKYLPAVQKQFTKSSQKVGRNVTKQIPKIMLNKALIAGAGAVGGPYGAAAAKAAGSAYTLAGYAKEGYKAGKAFHRSQKKAGGIKKWGKLRLAEAKKRGYGKTLVKYGVPAAERIATEVAMATL